MRIHQFVPLTSILLASCQFALKTYAFTQSNRDDSLIQQMRAKYTQVNGPTPPSGIDLPSYSAPKTSYSNPRTSYSNPRTSYSNPQRSSSSPQQHIDLSSYSTPQDLCDAVDARALKSHLTKIGLRSDGTPLEMAKVLFMTKVLKMDDIPEQYWAGGRRALQSGQNMQQRRVNYPEASWQ
eukprot:CAMPEP_0178640458 /NCGR_PEP_ID=MMETSP0698-20121128/16029_1 /TAXON_ID=265572 /ORGANISM="Extubocellulus spinifer, Strain CCMP396" /LENGTH=179 /DNA_ID=CAMNT_0020280903 /DNA_START=169 /DNA_END=708 /DNA_ORIENTATION=-